MKIAEILNKLKTTASPELDRRIDNLIKQAEKKQTQTSNTWSIIMKSKTTKFTTAAMVFIAVLIGINHFGISIDGTSVAWADILKQIVVAETAEFDLLIEKDGQVLQSSHLICKAPGKIKQLMPDGTVNIVDFGKYNILILNTNAKKATLRQISGESSELSQLDVFGNFQKRLEKMIHFQDETVENLGLDTIDGQEVIGFRIKVSELDEVIGWQGKGTFTVWADTQSKLPIRMEWYDDMYGINTIADKMELNMEVDDHVFDMNVPDGFELKRIEHKVSKSESMTNPTAIDEKRILKGYRGWVFLSDGVFPSSMTMNAIKDLDPEARMTIKQEGWGFRPTLNKRIDLGVERFGFTEENPPTEEEKKALNKKLQKAMNNAFGGFMAVFRMPADSDWHYAGKDVMMGETDRAIFWYRPMDSKNYRVIYGDLTVEDVAPEDLPE